MATYTHERMKNIIKTYREVTLALNKFSIAISEAEPDEYTQEGREFVTDMAFCHKRMHETLIIYQSDVVEAEAIMEVEDDNIT